MGGTVAKGQNIVLSTDINQVKVTLAWQSRDDGNLDLDVAALLLGQDRKVRSDRDMVFYNQPASDDGAVVLTGKSVEGDRGTDSAVVDLESLPDDVDCIAVVATIDGGGIRSARTHLGRAE